jgi:hypothetical protein
VYVGFPGQAGLASMSGFTGCSGTEGTNPNNPTNFGYRGLQPVLGFGFNGFGLYGYGFELYGFRARVSGFMPSPNYMSSQHSACSMLSRQF